MLRHKSPDFIDQRLSLLVSIILMLQLISSVRMSNGSRGLLHHLRFYLTTNQLMKSSYYHPLQSESVSHHYQNTLQSISQEVDFDPHV